MLGLINKVLGRVDAAKEDADRVYAALMTQSRQPGFYGNTKVPDSFQGRTEVLLMHLAVVMKACLAHGEQGKLLQQALFDRMRDDFDIALREEGYSDAGVKRRIKPMIALFYQTAQQYFEALDEADNTALHDVLVSAANDEVDGIGQASAAYVSRLAGYVRGFWDRASSLSLGDIAQARFDIPEIPA